MQLLLQFQTDLKNSITEMFKKKILLISFVFSPNIGGVESHLDDLCQYLIKKGHQVVVITYQPLLSNKNAPSFEIKGNLEIRRISWLRFNLFNRLEKLSLFEIFYLVPPILIYSFFYLLKHRKNIDVIQTHGFNMAIVGAVLSTIFRINFTVNTHVNFSFDKETFYSKVLRSILNMASKILVLTKGARNELAKIGVRKEKIVVYHQWIDTKLFKERDQALSRKKTNLNLEKFIVLFTGRFIIPKGINLLLKASEIIKNNIQFVFVGSGELKDEIKKHTQKNKSIYFVGKVERNMLPYYYSASDISIIPSIKSTNTYSEGIPRVMIEAFCCGRPVIATNTGGIKELLNDKVGFTIQANINSIANTLEKVSKNKLLLRKMGKECKKYAKNEFSLEQNAEIIENSLL